MRKFLRLAAGAFGVTIASRVSAAVYNGAGPTAGVNATTALQGVAANPDIRVTVVDILQKVLSYMALIAVIAVIVAGIYLIVGMGSDDSREKAKKIILYTLVGLVIILFSRIIVSLVTVIIASQL